MAGKKPTKSPKLDVAEGEGGTGGEAEASEEQQQVLERIVSIQNEIDQLNEQASEEILHVEQKYNRLRKPHFEHRSELIRELPDFWLTTLLNHPQFPELLGEEDETVLQYLENLKVDEFEDVKSGYRINLHFRPNPYFENEVLSKEYILDSNGESTVKGTEIKWKPGKNLVERAPPEMKGKKRGHEDIMSFFNWFSESDTSQDEPAEIIKDDIWPNPLQYFLGGETSVDAGEEGYEEEEEEEEEEDDGLEAEEEEEEEPDQDEIVELSDDEEEAEDEG